jgi:NAD-dependent histone deacetylase SIR2
MGTSLTVHPFASLAGMVDSSCPRVLINLDHVGDFGSRTDDVVLLGRCDDVVKDLCKELGWEDELLRFWDETEASVVTDIPGKEKKSAPSRKENVKGLEKPDSLEEIEEQFTKLTVAEEATETSVKEDDLSESKNATSSEKSVTISPAGAADKGDKAATRSKSVPRAPVARAVVEEHANQEAQAVDNKL